MDRKLRDKIQKAKRQEQIIKDALEFNYFNREKRLKCFKDLKKIQLYILKLYLEDANNENS